MLALVAAIVTGVAGERLDGLARLKHMENDYPHCAEVAGAYFFLSRFDDPTRSPDLSRKFCDSPFVKFETLMDGTVAPCCSIWTEKRLGHIGRSGFDDIWNSAGARDMRASILDGSFRHCNKQRCTAILEDTLPDRSEVRDPMMRAVIDGDTVVLTSKPRWLFLAHDVSCNLACPSCRDRLLGADAAQEARFDRIERQVFHPLLDSDDETTISVAGQGDPWASHHYRSILRHIAGRERPVTLNIHTNGLLMTEQRWAQFAGLEKHRPLVDVSIDACTPWVYEVVRRPGRWDKLEPNLRFIARRRAAGTFREFHLNATVQLDNYHEMPQLIAFAETIGADSMRLYMMQNTGAHIASTFARKNVADPCHPLHAAFLETLRDPCFDRPVAHLYDVDTWRTIAQTAKLPSDDLETDFSRADLDAALARAMGTGNHAAAVALCAAGHIRFAGDPDLLRAEACALEALGFHQQAAYRVRDAAAACRPADCP
jgi:MoaA/NifB/PqqE/SkfB family radical SAM enzyme